MRVKTGITRRRNHKKLHQATEGYRMTKRKLVKVSKEALLHAGQYAFNSRRKRKGEFRKSWIMRLNAALRSEDMTYSSFIHMLAQKNIGVNRKILASLALDEPEVFTKIVAEIKK